MAYPSTCELGGTDLQVSGAARARPATDERAGTILTALLHAGIDFIDILIDYGVSEERIGHYTSHRQSEHYLASKCGCVAGAAIRRITMALIISVGASEVQAAESGVTRFWNLTGETITHLYLASTGTGDWGADQCRNDRDGSVDFDERLPITALSSGRYDVKFTNKADRTCIVKDIEIKAGAVFTIGKELAGQCGGE